MRFEILFLETGVGATISNQNVRDKEIWLEDSLKACWTVWAELGWKGPNKTIIKDEDWKKHLELKKRHRPNYRKGPKHRVIKEIERLSCISHYEGFDVNHNFDQGGDWLLEIISLIRDNSFCFDPIDIEVRDIVVRFRKVVTEYLATGVKRGCEMSNDTDHKRFVHSIREILGNNPIDFPGDAEVDFNRFHDETLISVTGAPNTDFELNCECITVEL